MTIQELRDQGFDVDTRNHALAILGKDFPEPVEELCDVLSSLRIADEELVRGGGGEAPFTQRLRSEFGKRSWQKRQIRIRKQINGKSAGVLVSHEIDHVRSHDRGSVALEIEWNNKDPFFDRDLQNFQRLHAEGALSVGILVTRGQGLQENLPLLIWNCVQSRGVENLEGLEETFGYRPTDRQRKRVAGVPEEQFLMEWAKAFVGDKFGTATTHWSKLQERLDRGVGNPCPLLLIGIPANAVVQTRRSR